MWTVGAAATLGAAMRDAVPAGVALLAGGLAVFNPCGFPVLAAFLAYSLGDDGAGSRAPNQIARGLMTGLMVTSGFLAVFTVLGLPLSLGVAVISDVVSWVGLAFGLAMLAIGLVAVAGRHVGLPQFDPVRLQTRHRATAGLVFGVGYGVASLACTLPLFLALVGAGAGGGGAQQRRCACSLPTEPAWRRCSWPWPWEPLSSGAGSLGRPVACCHTLNRWAGCS